MVEKAKVGELVFDFTLYPRQAIDRTNVNRMKDALESGRHLPPIIADRASKRIVDGFHRVKAVLELKGQDGEIEVEWREFTSENAIRIEAMALNSAHGRALSPFEIAHCLFVGRQYKIKVEKLAEALGLTLARLREIEAEREASTDGHPIMLKKTVSHLVGEVLTAHQAEAAAKVGGMRPTYYVNQVINLLEGDLVDVNNEALMERLHYLARLLEKRMAVPA